MQQFSRDADEIENWMLEKLQLAGKIIIILKLCQLVSIAEAFNAAFLKAYNDGMQILI